MKTITLAASAINQTPLAWSANERNLRAAIRAARAAGAQLLCLPELSTTGYGCEDAFLAENTQLRAWQMLRSLLPETAGMVVSFGLPVLHQNTVFNAAALVVDQRITALVCKRHLAGDGIHYEPRWFKPWPVQVRDVFLAPDNAEEIPLGDLLVDVGGIRIGFEICEDAWVAQRPGADLAALAVDVILNPSASHFAFGKRDLRRRFVQEGSRAFGASYIYSNLSGNEAGRAIYDGQTIIAIGGVIVAEGPRFQPCPQLVTTATVDVSLTRLAQARTTSHRVALPATHHPLVVRTPFDWAAALMRPGPPPLPADWETSAFLKEEEFTRAVAVALFDYLRKSGTRGFTVSLSGGADSAAVVCLVHLMVRLLLAENPGWLRDCLPFLPHETDPLSLTGALLVSAYQATEHSGPETRAAAATLAKAIGARHHELELTAPSRLSGLDRPCHRASARLAMRRHSAPKHPGPDPRAGRLDARQSNQLVAAHHLQPQRGSRRLRDHGWRYRRLARAHRGDRQSVAPALVELAGNYRSAPHQRPLSAAGVGLHQPPTAHGRTPPGRRSADRRGRSDALSGVGRDGTRRHPRQTKPGRRDALDSPTISPLPATPGPRVDHPLLHPLVAQPMETRTLRPQFPP